MVNSLRGEIGAELDGKTWTLCLTLGALATLEKQLDAESLTALSNKLSNGKLKASELIKIIHAGLVGGGYTLSVEEVAEMRVEGGIASYIDIAVRLLQATFTPLEHESE